MNKRTAPKVAPKGFRPKPKRTARLHFNDGDYEGAEVLVSLDGSVDLYTELQTVMVSEVSDSDDVALVFRRFGREVLLEWNILDLDDEPIPATAAGCLRAPTPFMRATISAWIDAVVAVAAPLGETSKPGDTSEEET